MPVFMEKKEDTDRYKTGKEVYKIQSTSMSLFGTKNPGESCISSAFSKHNGSWPSAYSGAFIFSRELFL